GQDRRRAAGDGRAPGGAAVGGRVVLVGGDAAAGVVGGAAGGDDGGGRRLPGQRSAGDGCGIGGRGAIDLDRADGGGSRGCPGRDVARVVGAAKLHQRRAFGADRGHRTGTGRGPARAAIGGAPVLVAGQHRVQVGRAGPRHGDRGDVLPRQR